MKKCGCQSHEDCNDCIKEEMRDRQEIRESYDWADPADSRVAVIGTGLMLEVLLDIRDLLKDIRDEARQRERHIVIR